MSNRISGRSALLDQFACGFAVGSQFSSERLCSSGGIPFFVVAEFEAVHCAEGLDFVVESIAVFAFGFVASFSIKSSSGESDHLI